MMTWWRGVVLILACLAWALPARGDVVTLPAVDDNTLYEDPDGTVSNGLGEHMFVGRSGSTQRHRALVRFDFSAIPPGSIINSVSLKLYMSRTTSGLTTVTAHRLTASWGEGNSIGTGGQGGGGAVTPNDATWIHRFWDNTFWSTPGGDFVAAPSAAVGVSGTGSYTWSGAGLVADVQAWVNTPASNFGWLLQGDETPDIRTSKRFETHESATPSQRPALIINFTPSFATGACCIGGGACQVMTPEQCAAAGGVYQGGGVSCLPNPCAPTGGACCLPTGTCLVTTADDCAARGGVYQGDDTACSGDLCPIVLTPFVDELPRPGVAQPISGQPGGAAEYQISILRVAQQLHRDLPPTMVWGYNGTYPGPTIEARSGQPVTVTWVNDLRTATGAPLAHHDLAIDTCMHGPDTQGDTPRTVTHLHGGRVPAEFDGNPELTQLPGQASPPYLYPNGQSAGTLWYHDHALGITRLNVYLGLAGFYLIRDAQEDALGLPSGLYEVPLAIQDRSFRADGSLRYPQTDHDHFFGDTMLVNGKVWPYMNVKRGKYRFRLLNGCNARVLTLALSDGGTISLIGNEGGLLAAPVTRSSITIAPGERADVVIDFASRAPGSEIILTNSAPAPFPGQPGVGVVPNVMKFIVQADTGGNPGPLPGTLRTITPLNPAQAAQQRTFNLEKVTHPCLGSMWMINGLLWDDITEFPRYGDVEIWSFVNKSGVVHPMHIHLVQFQVLDRQPFTITNGQVVITGPRVPVGADEGGWKDTVRANPMEITRVIARFDGFGGTFPYHCHVLEHEDHEMMRQFTVTCWGDITGQPRDRTAALGGTTLLTCDATGAGTLTYRWFKDGVPLADGLQGSGSVISGATAAYMTISNVRPGDAGRYRCDVRDECGLFSSRNAQVLVNPSCDPDLNLDGNADQDDVAYLVQAIAGGPNPANADLDFNRDGNADQDDVWKLIDVIAGGRCP
jgi:spore coat protein A